VRHATYTGIFWCACGALRGADTGSSRGQDGRQRFFAPIGRGMRPPGDDLAGVCRTASRYPVAFTLPRRLPRCLYARNAFFSPSFAVCWLPGR